VQCFNLLIDRRQTSNINKSAVPVDQETAPPEVQTQSDALAKRLNVVLLKLENLKTPE